MSLNDPLANVLSHVLNCEKRAKQSCLVKPVSKMIVKVLDLLQKERYLGEGSVVEKAKGGIIKVYLLGNINKCGAIKPRFSVKHNEFEKFEKRYLPAKGFGVLIVSTPKGIMLHRDAIAKKLGGKLLAYCY